MSTRRNIIAGALILASLAVSPATAQEKLTEIRIGTQKGGFFPAVRQRRTVEDAFKPLGIEVIAQARQLGIPIQQGQVVTTGTCHPPLPIAAGDRIDADFGQFGTVSVSIV